MKTLSKIKSIYLLAIVAILSFCMFLFPTMGRTARAEGETAKLGDGKITINSAYIMAHTYNDKGVGAVEGDTETHDKWAIMFKASVTEEEYNKITQNGAVKVKLGMLIGLTARFEQVDNVLGAVRMHNIIDYKDDIKLKFTAISYVGAIDLGAQEVSFTETDKVFEFEAGMIYDETDPYFSDASAEEFAAQAGKDLTVIPFYMTVPTVQEATTIDTYKILWEQRKNVTPRDLLVEAYASQQIKNDGQPAIEGTAALKDSLVEDFVGAIPTFETNENYICRSTNRIMVGESGGELTASDFVDNGKTASISFNRKPVGTSNGTEGGDKLDASFVDTLDYDSDGNIIAYAEDTISIPREEGDPKEVVYSTAVKVYYGIKVVDRVIMRFSDKTIGQTENIDTTEDYLAVAGTTNYTSIFAVDNSVANIYATGTGTAKTKFGTATVYVTMDKGYNGLYVLGKSIAFPNEDNEYIVYKNATFDGNITSSAGASTKQSYSAPIYGLGFNGTFDGRGLYIDANKMANQGIFPSSFDATVKNTAFLNLTQTGQGGGIMAHARKTTFENIYATVASVTNNKGDLNKGILMNVQDCDFKNFVAYVDVAVQDRASAHAKADGTAISKITTNISASALTTGMGHGQGVRYSGVFSFRAYPDMFYDTKAVSGGYTAGVRYLDGAAADNVKNQFVARINNVLGAEEIERLFPNAVILQNSEDTVGTTNLLAGFNDGLKNVANPSPFTITGYTGTTEAGGTRKYANELNTAFVGTTGENVYTIGSSPLYLAHQFVEADGVVKIAGTGDYQRTTVFVNEAPALASASGGKADINWKVVNGVATAPTAYTWNEIAGDMFEIAFTDSDGNEVAGSLDTVKADTFLSLGEIIVYGKSFISAPSKIKSLTGTTTTGNNIANILVNGSASTKLDVQFVNQEGFYDCATEAEMVKGMTSAKTQLFKDAGFWSVVETEGEGGATVVSSITWKNLPAA